MAHLSKTHSYFLYGGRVAKWQRGKTSVSSSATRSAWKLLEELPEGHLPSFRTGTRCRKILEAFQK